MFVWLLCLLVAALLSYKSADKAHISLFYLGDKTESQGSIPEFVAAISGMETKVMALSVSRGTKTNFFLQNKEPNQKRKKIEPGRKETICMQEVIEAAREKAQSQQVPERSESSAKEIVLEAELEQAKREITDLKEKIGYLKNHYTVSTLDEDVLKMETGLPTRDVFNIVVSYTERFKDQINYFAGWRVESIRFEDQIFVTLMKVRQNYTNLHLAQLFSCSVSTIANIVTTFIHVIHSILFIDLMVSILLGIRTNCLPHHHLINLGLAG